MGHIKITKLRERLTQALSPTHLEIIDESSKHIGHAGAASGGGHFAIEISSTLFEGKSLVECHRLIYQALGDMMSKEIHALRIKIIKKPSPVQ